MSAPIGELTLLATLWASLAGSGHCASMCGPLVTSATRDKRSWALYQLGRLAGYAALGAAAGSLGSRFLPEDYDASVPALVAAGLMALGYILAGISVWRGKMPHLKILPQAWLGRLYAKARPHAWAGGLLSAFLPCGWLHVFVLSSATAKSAPGGALLLFAFWLGTLPALAVAPWAARRFVFSWAGRSPRLAALLLIAVGVAGLGIKARPLMEARDGGEMPACHHDSGR